MPRSSSGKLSGKLKKTMPIRGGVKKRRSKGFARRVSSGGTAPLTLNAAPIPVATIPKVSSWTSYCCWGLILSFSSVEFTEDSNPAISDYHFQSCQSINLICLLFSPKMENLLKRKRLWRPCPKDINHRLKHSLISVRSRLISALIIDFR